MPIIIWNDRLLVGMAEFDEHHQHLVGLLNKVYDNFTDGASSENLGNILKELEGYTDYHFEAEETSMQLYGYPKLNEHKAEHAEFKNKISELMSVYTSGKHDVSIEILTFLKEWLTNHILKVDIDYCRYYSNENIDIQVVPDSYSKNYRRTIY